MTAFIWRCCASCIHSIILYGGPLFWKMFRLWRVSIPLCECVHLWCAILMINMMLIMMFYYSDLVMMLLWCIYDDDLVMHMVNMFTCCVNMIMWMMMHLTSCGQILYDVVVHHAFIIFLDDDPLFWKVFLLWQASISLFGLCAFDDVFHSKRESILWWGSLERDDQMFIKNIGTTSIELVVLH